MVLSILFGELGKISTANVVDLESVIEEVIVFWNIVTYRRDTFSLHSEVFILWDIHVRMGLFRLFLHVTTSRISF